MGVVIEAVVVVAVAEVEEEVCASREDLLLLAGRGRHVGGEEGGILLPLHHLRLPELVVQATGVEVIQGDFATCQNDWNTTVVEEFRLREAQRGEALPMLLLLLLLLYIVKVVEEGESRRKTKLFRFVIVGLLLLLSLEGEEESIDRRRKLGWVGLGRGQIIITRMCACVCVLYLPN